jgi:ribosomal RNA assembly protein
VSTGPLRIRVPLERIGVLIGHKGKTKSAIEENLGVLIDIDGETGNVEIAAKPEGNPANVFRARDVVTAIGRGFSPENAFRLFSEESHLLVIDLSDFCGKSVSCIKRIKARIIGTNGKARRNLEELTRTRISIYGDTVAVIGDIEHCEAAREALMMLIRGNTHRTVYNFLRSRRAELKRIETELWRVPPETGG